VLRGEELARTYANMDLFVFPSRTDTFGNVIQESASSQVAAVVTNDGGPRQICCARNHGTIAERMRNLSGAVELCGDRRRLRKMGVAAREKVYRSSWMPR
jgi:glycosyltransferase involved in cell wall biosynthesis